MPTISISSIPMPRCKERVFIHPNRFIYLGVSFDAIPEKHEIDPMNYDKTMSDVDVYLWQKAMKVKLESMYSNQVCKLVETPKKIKHIGCK